MAIQFKMRRDTAANWTSSNPTLGQGEFGYETDTNKLKVGDGTMAWTSLSYWAGYLNPVPSDHTASGEITTLTAHENMTIGQVSYINSDGECQLAKADAIANASALVICASASISANATGSFMFLGFIRDDTWTWTAGGKLYLDAATAGAITQTAPSGANNVIQILGVASHADRIFFNPSLVQVEHT